MPEDQFDYDQLMHEAHRGIIRKVLRRVSQEGLTGEHHFYIVFDTTHPEVRLSDRLLAQYPQEMTIILQFQFKKMRVLDNHFEVQLSFDNIPEILKIPYTAINGFVDPSVPFVLRLQSNPDVGLENSISMLVPGLPQRAVDHHDEDEDDFDEELMAFAEKSEPPELRSVSPPPPTPLFGRSKASLNSDEQQSALLESIEEQEEVEEETPTADVVSLDAFRKKS